MKQNKLDSLFEALTNTFVGFIISLFAQLLFSHIVGIQMTVLQNIQLVLLMTIVSILRQYIIRRLFDGKTIWKTIKAKLA